MPDYDPPNDPKAPQRDPVAEAEWRAHGGTAWEEAASITDLPSKDAHFEDPAADMRENELQAGIGEVCPVCHRAIEAGEPVRRRIDGTYQHDAC